MHDEAECVDKQCTGVNVNRQALSVLGKQKKLHF